MRSSGEKSSYIGETKRLQSVFTSQYHYQILKVYKNPSVCKLL